MIKSKACCRVFDFAEEDFHQRQIIAARREADTILAALDTSRKNEAWDKLRSDERDQIAKLETGLRAVKDSDDYQSIRKGIDVLNQATTRLAELMMDTAVATALKGKAMDATNLEEGPAAGHPMAKAEFK
jgi:hypothetical protein